MPIYEYCCTEHGVFEDQKPMSQSAEPGSCPECQAPAPRVLSAVRTRLVERATSVALSRNERSRHSPELRQLEPGGARGLRGRDRRRPLQVSHGPRPWVLEHG